MEIKIILDNKHVCWGVQRTTSGQFHEYHERYLYLGSHYRDGETVNARLIYQSEYAKGQWMETLDHIAKDTDRKTRRVYLDSHDKH